jgi:hypothetical protein
MLGQLITERIFEIRSIGRHDDGLWPTRYNCFGQYEGIARVHKAIGRHDDSLRPTQSNRIGQCESIARENIGQSADTLTAFGPPDPNAWANVKVLFGLPNDYGLAQSNTLLTSQGLPPNSMGD